MLSCDEVRQRTVIDAAGLAIGVVEAVLIDLASWQVGGLRVRLRREMTEQLGVAWSFFRKTTIDVPRTAIQSVGDAIILKIRAEELREATAAVETPASH